MIKALKALQDKIRALELERAAAAEKFRHLGQQAEQHEQQHNVRLQVNRSSQYSTPPSDTSTEGKTSVFIMYYYRVVEIFECENFQKSASFMQFKDNILTVPF